MKEVQTIPARRGSAACVQRGQMVKVINTHGEQVVFFFACPQDILPVNGTAGRPTEAHFQVIDTEPQQGGHAA